MFYSEGSSGEYNYVITKVRTAHPEITFEYRDPSQIASYLPATADGLLSKYNTIMLSDVSYGRLTAQQVSAIREYVQRGGGFVMIGGDSSFGPGGYSGTPIEEVLPVTCGSGYVWRTTSFRVVDGGHPVLYGLPIDTIPTVTGYDVAYPKAQASLVLKGDNNAALLVCWSYGKGRSVAFTPDITYAWGNNLKQWSSYGSFIANMLKWAAGRIGTKTGYPAVADVAKLNPSNRTASYTKDPVDTGTGAHVLERTLLTVHGAQELSFIASYNSLLLNEGPLGRGWGHNFEARLESLPDGNIDLHWTANRVNRFVYNGTDTYSSLDLATRFDTITKHADGSFTLKLKDKSVYEFDSSGKLVELKNKYGQPVDLSYNADGRIETITEAISGRALTVTYNVYGLIDSVTDPLGRSVSFSYDGSHNLTRITDAEGHYIDYAYNGDGRIERATDDEGVQIFYNTYDELGRVATQDDA
ncbi:MAG: glutamine amidotransferase [Bacillota bacterium]